MQRTRSDILFDAINTIIMIVIVLIFLYPIYFIILASISEPYDVANGNVTLWFKGFSLEAYRNVLVNQDIWSGYRNSLIYTAIGTVFSLALTLPTAYVLSKKHLPGRGALSWYYLFTMYFSGGLIPSYLLVKSLGLINKPYTLIVLGGISVYNIIVTRIFLQNTIPEELYESARIDGASDFRQFFQIALPLSSPIIAVMALYYGAGRWNDYYAALIYISSNEYMPLQMILRSILIQNQTLMVAIMDPNNMNDEVISDLARKAYIAESMKYALIFIASAPLLAAYPFVQKYFVKGVMIGSLKG